jgi:hypothetical protein
MRRATVVLLCIATLAAAVHPQRAAAHPLGFSGFRFLIWQGQAKAIYTLHTRDMSDWFPPLKYPDYVNDVCRAIIAKPEDLLDVQFDGQPVAPTEKKAFSPETGMIQVELTYPITQFPTSVALWSKQLVRLPRGHQQLLFVEDMRRNPTGESGPSLYEGALSSDQDGATVEIPESASLIHPPATRSATTIPMTTTPATMSPTRPTTAPAAAPVHWLLIFILLVVAALVLFDAVRRVGTALKAFADRYW